MSIILTLISSLYAWACERLYHEFAWSYDLIAWFVSLGNWAAWRRLALDETPAQPSRVLELGFGTGALLAEMAQKGWPVVGLDAAWPMQQVTARRLLHSRVRAPHIQAIAQSMPFHSASFDAVLSTFPAPYILAPETLAECRRVLRPSGRLVIVGLWVTPKSPALSRVLLIFFGAPAAQWKQRLHDRLAEAGFSAIEIAERPNGWVRVGIVTAEPGGGR